MLNITINDLLEKVKEYNPEEVEYVRKAYEFAKNLHDGQIRQSGEPYINHPLYVSNILVEMHADKDTLCAGLLHDTLEDTGTTKQEIAQEFNKNVANLVDGVTKMSKMNFSSKSDQNVANTRKIITGITEDVRIIIIKLADRLHNMRTLEYKSEFKQKENSLETMEITFMVATEDDPEKPENSKQEVYVNKMTYRIITNSCGSIITLIMNWMDKNNTENSPRQAISISSWKC